MWGGALNREDLGRDWKVFGCMFFLEADGRSKREREKRKREGEKSQKDKNALIPVPVAISIPQTFSFPFQFPRFSPAPPSSIIIFIYGILSLCMLHRDGSTPDPNDVCLTISAISEGRKKMKRAEESVVFFFFFPSFIHEAR